MFDINAVRQEHTNATDQLAYEVNTLWEVFQETDWYGNTKHFPNAHHGYVMMCFARIDLLSLYWRPPYDPVRTPQYDHKRDKQTLRMRAFMEQYLYPQRVHEIRVAVQLWRHTLMHTSEPRRLRDKRTNQEYEYLLHFGDWLPREQHFTFASQPTTEILNVAITYLVDDLRTGTDKYLNDLEADIDSAQAKYMQTEPHIRLQEFCSP